MIRKRTSTTFFVIVAVATSLVFSQGDGAFDPAALERSVYDMNGTEKLRAYHNLVEYYARIQPKKAVRFAERAVELAENIINERNPLLEPEDLSLKAETFLLAGLAYEKRKFFLESKTAYEIALVEAEALEDATLITEANQSVARIDSISRVDKGKKRFLGNTFSDISTALTNSTNEAGVSATWAMAENQEEEGNYSRAITNYSALLNHYTDQGDWETVLEIREKIAELNQEMGNYRAALDELEVINAVAVQAGDSALLNDVKVQIDSIEREVAGDLGEIASIETLGVKASALTMASIHSLFSEYVDEAGDIKSNAQAAESNQDYRQSLSYYKEYMELERQLTEEKSRREVARLEQQHVIENRDREILLLKQNEEIVHLELERQTTFKQSLLIGLILAGFILLTVFKLYSNKQRDHKKLVTAYDGLEVAQNKLLSAEQRIKQLLGQQISGAVAEELLTAESDHVARKFVCVMFLDIRNFTGFAEQLLPEEIIDYQNKVFGFMIDAVNQHKGIVNQILGDGFMATFGAPISAGNDCLKAYMAAREIMNEVQRKSDSGEIPRTRVGIGLHAGHVVAGNVGTQERKQYSITGNTVIIAARLEQLNKEFGSTLVLSKEVYEQLPKELVEPVAFNAIHVKGRSQPVEVAAI